jgi:hypothetical protein
MHDNTGLGTSLVMVAKAANMCALRVEVSTLRETRRGSTRPAICWSRRSSDHALGSHPCRIAKGYSTGRNVAGDHATRTDQRIVADAHTRQDDGAAADPDITANANGTAKLQSGGPPRRIAWMISRKDLDGRTDLRFVADADRDDVEDHAIEVQENTGAETDVEAIIAMKWWPDHGPLTDRGEAFQQQLSAFGGRGTKRRVVTHEPAVRCRKLRLECRVAGIVELAGEQLLPLRAGPLLVCHPRPPGVSPSSYSHSSRGKSIVINWAPSPCAPGWGRGWGQFSYVPSILCTKHPATRPFTLGDTVKTECPKISTACTTQLHDRRRDGVSLDEVERIVI